jgi:hypothetical protein
MAEIPIRSDRAAHNSIDYPELHAKDLDDGTPIQHLPADPEVGDMVQWDGTKWVLVAAAELAGDIDDLDDVEITSLADGELLQSASGVWINQTLAEAGIAAAGHNHTGVYSPVGHTHTMSDMTTRWEVLTNGNPATPELMFDENGDVLYVEVEA